MISLGYAKKGIYKIVSVRRSGKLRRMYNMGIFIGDIIEVIKPGPGPVIIRKGNIRIGIGLGIAQDIFVQPI